MNGSQRGIEYATERMLEAEAAGNYTLAIWWAEARERVIAAGAVS